MSMPEIDTPNQIETAIAEALTGIERQRQMIADFQARGYDVRAPLTLLACLLVNLRRLEDKRWQEDVEDQITRQRQLYGAWEKREDDARKHQSDAVGQPQGCSVL